jgi:hypothetical protein
MVAIKSLPIFSSFGTSDHILDCNFVLINPHANSVCVAKYYVEIASFFFTSLADLHKKVCDVKCVFFLFTIRFLLKLFSSQE